MKKCQWKKHLIGFLTQFQFSLLYFERVGHQRQRKKEGIKIEIHCKNVAKPFAFQPLKQ